MQRDSRNHGDITDDSSGGCQSWGQCFGIDYHSGVGSVVDVYAGNSGNTYEWLESLPRGTPLPSGMNALDAISETVAGIRPAQMMEVLASMKTFIMEQPDRARALLTAQPQLAYALFQALLVHKIVDPAILHCMNSASGRGSYKDH